jgi:hypothetical protein
MIRDVHQLAVGTDALRLTDVRRRLRAIFIGSDRQPGRVVPTSVGRAFVLIAAAWPIVAGYPSNCLSTVIAVLLPVLVTMRNTTRYALDLHE